MEKMVGRGRGGDGVVNAEKGRYERLNDLTRKYEGSLSVLEDAEGNKMKTLQDLEKEVRANRDFWHKEPEPIADDLHAILKEYGETAEEAPHMEMPGVTDCKEKILRTPDTGCGVDAAPYAMIRLVPQEASEVMVWMIKSWTTNGIQKGEIYPPQLLVWIEKANAGVTNESWRPLNLAVTFVRAI